MFKLIAINHADRKQIKTFEKASDARDAYNNLLNDMAIIEIFEVTKLKREQLNTYAQLEEECERLKCNEE